jgi:hypothetical protein
MSAQTAWKVTSVACVGHNDRMPDAVITAIKQFCDTVP